MLNYEFAIAPFGVGITLSDYSSEKGPHWLAEVSQNVSRPKRPWRTTAIDEEQYLEFENSSTSVDAFYVARTNYEEFKLEASVDGITWYDVSPNLVLSNEDVSDPVWSDIASGTLTSGDGPFAGGIAVGFITLVANDGMSQIFTFTDASANGVDQYSLVTYAKVASGTTTSLTSILTIGNTFATSTTTINNREWTRIEIGPIPLAVGTTGSVEFKASTASVGVLTWRPSVIPHDTGVTAASLNTLLKTGANGIVIPEEPFCGRRSLACPVYAKSENYYRYIIPADQTLLSGSGYYETGVAVLINNLEQAEHGHLGPMDPIIIRPEKATQFESRATQRSSRGDIKIHCSIAGTYIERDHGDLFRRISRSAPGTPILVIENCPIADSELYSLTDRSKAYIMEISGDVSFVYGIPELFDHSISLEEIT